MNQMLSSTAIDTLMSLLPTAKPKVVPEAMTRREKLQRWADIVRPYKGHLSMFHLLEHQRAADLPKIGDPLSAFHLAGADQVLQDQGIKADIPGRIFGTSTTSAAEVMRFFELSQAQLHEFSCDCGGIVSAALMADRIEGIARRT
jgi:hypothetical protein